MSHTPRTPATPATPAVRGSTKRKNLFVSPLSARNADPNKIAQTGKDPRTYFGKFLIMLVLEENIDDLATFITEKGADPNFVDPDDFTPLYVAVKHKLNECAFALVRLGAFVTKRTSTYPSPLQLAIQTGNTELVKFFENWLNTVEEQWAAAKRATPEDEPSRKRRRVEVSPSENGDHSEKTKK